MMETYKIDNQNEYIDSNIIDNDNKFKKKHKNKKNNKELHKLKLNGIKIINKIKENRNSCHFLFPVDIIALNIPDYHNIIKEPMDLSTVENNLKKYIYNNKEEYNNDMTKIWNNAKLYNPDFNYIHKIAYNLQIIYNDLYEKIFNNIENVLEKNKEIKNKNEMISKKDRYKLYYLLKSLSFDELEQVWNIIISDTDIFYSGEIKVFDIHLLDKLTINKITEFVKKTIGYNKNLIKKYNNSFEWSNNLSKDKNINNSIETNNSSFLLIFNSDSN